MDSLVYAQDQDVSRGLLLQYRNSGDDYPERWEIGLSGTGPLHSVVIQVRVHILDDLI